MNKNQMIATSALLVATAVFGDPTIAEAQTKSDTGWNSAATSQQIKTLTVQKIGRKPPGCNRRNQHPSRHISNITEFRDVPIPHWPHGATVPMTFTKGTMYLNCEQPGRDKVLPKWESACWTITRRIPPGFKASFTGVTFNGYIWSPSNGHSVNPSKFKVNDKRGRQNCETHDIKASEEEWLWGNVLNSTRRDARQRTNITVNFWDYWDPNYSSKVKKFNPANDFTM